MRSSLVMYVIGTRDFQRRLVIKCTFKTAPAPPAPPLTCLLMPSLGISQSSRLNLYGETPGLAGRIAERVRCDVEDQVFAIATAAHLDGSQITWRNGLERAVSVLWDSGETILERSIFVATVVATSEAKLRSRTDRLRPSQWRDSLYKCNRS
jgi:hypothetical protein